MRRIALAAVVVTCALAGGVARAAGTFSVTPGTVASGGSVTVSFCGFASGDSGYYTVNGPSVSSTRFWGPASGPSCLTYVEPTTGWAAGKYKFIAYQTGPTGRNSKIGSADVTVTP
jgi:hypothetical protein